MDFIIYVSWLNLKVCIYVCICITLGHRDIARYTLDNFSDDRIPFLLFSLSLATINKHDVCNLIMIQFKGYDVVCCVKYTYICIYLVLLLRILHTFFYAFQESYIRFVHLHISLSPYLFSLYFFIFLSFYLFFFFNCDMIFRFLPPMVQ